MTHRGLEFVNSKGGRLRIMLAVSSCGPGFVCYFSDDVDSLAHRVEPVCLLHR